MSKFEPITGFYLEIVRVKNDRRNRSLKLDQDYYANIDWSNIATLKQIVMVIQKSHDQAASH